MMKRSMKMVVGVVVLLLFGLILQVVRLIFFESTLPSIESELFWVTYIGLTSGSCLTAWVFGVFKENLYQRNRLAQFGFVCLAVGPVWIELFWLLFFYQGRCLADPVSCLVSSRFFANFEFQMSITFVVAWYVITMFLLLSGWGYSTIAMEWARKQQMHLE